MKTLPDNLCVSVGEVSECMDGEILLAALLVECGIYFLLFVSGVKVVDYLRKILRGEKSGREKI